MRRPLRHARLGAFSRAAAAEFKGCFVLGHALAAVLENTAPRHARRRPSGRDAPGDTLPLIGYRDGGRDRD